MVRSSGRYLPEHYDRSRTAMLTGGAFHARRRATGQSGLTLVELLVAMIITALVSTALTMGFFTVLRGTDISNDQIARSAQAQRIGAAWTKDVQNVAPDGINTGSRCPDPKVTNPADINSVEEVDLVHFTWNPAPTSGLGQRMTASWVAVGRGSDLQLVRRECGAGSTTEQVLAKSLASGSQLGTEVIHGPDSSNPTDFCPARLVGGVSIWDSCTIIVAGRLDYSLTVARRVPALEGATSGALPPKAPQQVTVSPRNGYLAVAWEVVLPDSAQPAVTSYQVFVYTAANGPPYKVVPVDGSTIATDVAPLDNGTNYWVRVRAGNSVGFGEFSSTIGPVQPAPTPPEAATITAATANGIDGQVVVEWDLPSGYNDGGSEITGWTVIAEDSSTLERMTFGVDATPSSPISEAVRQFVVSGLTNGRTYRMMVKAHNDVVSTANPSGAGDESEPVEAVPFGLPPASEGVEAQGGDSKAYVRWTAVTEGNGRPVVGYRVLTYAGINAGSPVDSAGFTATTAEAGCAATCMVEVPLANDGQYYRFKVVTRTEASPGVIVDGEPTGPLSTGGQLNSAGVTGPKNPPYIRPSTSPAVPSTPVLDGNVAGTTAGTRKLTITTTTGSGGGEPLQRVNLQYRSRSTGSSTFGSWANVNKNGTDLAAQTVSFSVDNLTGGRFYEFRARGANTADWSSGTYRYSGYTSTLTTTLIGSPTPPKDVGLVRPAGSFGKTLVLSWNAPTDTGGEAVSYAYSCSAAGETTRAGSSSTTSPVTFSDLRDGKNWTCSVTASNSSGSSASQPSPAATPYGECTLTATDSLDIRQKKIYDRFRNEVVATRVEGSSNEIWGFLRFNLIANCAASDNRIPVNSYINDSQLYLYRTSGGDSDHVVANKTAFLSVFPETFGGKTMTASSIDWDNTPSHSVVKGAQIATFNLFPAKNAWFSIGASTKTRELFTTANQSTYWWGLIPERDGVQNNKAADFCATRGGNTCNGKAPYLLITFFTQGPV